MPTTLLSLPPELLTQIFCHLPNFKTYTALRATNQRLRNITETHHHLIFNHIAHNIYPPEAFTLLDCIRPSGISDAAKYRVVTLSSNTFQTDWDAFPLDPAPGVVGVAEMAVLERDRRKVERGVDAVLKAMGDDAGVVVGREVIRRAIYQVGILLCQWHLSEVVECEDVEDAEENCDEGMLRNEDNELMEDWTYDYSYAAGMSTQELCAVMGLEGYSDMGEGMLALVCDASRLDEDAEDVAMENDALLKRFVVAGLMDCGKVSEPFLEESVKGVMDTCVHKGLWKEAQESIKILDGWRKDPNLRWEKGYNTRLFEKKLRPVHCGDGAFRMKELLTLKQDGWTLTNPVEKKLIGHLFKTSPWHPWSGYGDGEDQLDGIQFVGSDDSDDWLSEYDQADDDDDDYF